MFQIEGANINRLLNLEANQQINKYGLLITFGQIIAIK
jgi:hypothetical protein